jgi:hypothetical protein
MTNPVGSKEQRENLRRRHQTRKMWIRGGYRYNLCGRCRTVYPCKIVLSLDGLDIAEEMAEAMRRGTCGRNSKSLAKWDRWKEGRDD